jgi:hypothetical protein
MRLTVCCPLTVHPLRCFARHCELAMTVLHRVIASFVLFDVERKVLSYRGLKTVSKCERFCQYLYTFAVVHYFVSALFIIARFKLCARSSGYSSCSARSMRCTHSAIGTSRHC